MTEKSDDGSIAPLLAIMERLRHPEQGCPWDREQDFASIAPYTIEEAYEVADAIERRDMNGLREELGDLLFQVVFHSEMAKEAGAFNIDDVINTIINKMITRHPHVFSSERIRTVETQTIAWEEQKESERRKNGVKDGALGGVAVGLPALTRALKLQKRAARVGFDWPDSSGPRAKVDEELGELDREMSCETTPRRIEHEVGDLLFACVNLARHLKFDPEQALRTANARFERRFRHMEERLAAQGREPADASLAELEALWQEAKTAD
jgi:MazG family protein